MEEHQDQGDAAGDAGPSSPPNAPDDTAGAALEAAIAASPLSLEHVHLAQECMVRLKGAAAFDRAWTRVLTDHERAKFRGGCDEAWTKYGKNVVTMFRDLRGGSFERAVLVLSRKLGFLREEDYEWLVSDLAPHDESVRELLRESLHERIADVPDVELVIDDLVASHALVLISGIGVRRAYWKGDLITTDWNQNAAQWSLLWQLAVAARRGQGVDRSDLNLQYGAMCSRRSRLKACIPGSLDSLIESKGEATYNLSGDIAQICVVEVDTDGTITRYDGSGSIEKLKQALKRLSDLGH